MVVLGLCWLVPSFPTIPQYGDTTEYIAFSQTLKVDQYRGIVYPLVVRASTGLGDMVGLRFTSILFALQILLQAGSAFLFALVVGGKLSRASGGKLPVRHALAAALVVAMNPLSLHFAVSVLPDALATSFVMILLTVMVLAADRASGLQRFAFWILCAGLVTLVLSGLRLEKLYLAVLVLAVFLAVLAARFTRRAWKPAAFRILCLLVLVSTAVGGAALIKRATTVEDRTRPALNVDNAIFNRVVWPRLARTRAFLPEPIRSSLTAEQAATFDSHNNNVMPFQAEALNDPAKGPAYLRSISSVAFQHFYGRIIARTAYDFAKYLFPGIYFPLEAVGVLPESAATSWTISRAAAPCPQITAAYFAVGSILFLLLMGLGAARILRAVRDPQGRPALVLIAACIVGNALMFALESGMDAHVRYALPQYTLTFEMALLLVLAANPALAGTARGAVPAKISHMHAAESS